MKFSTSKNTINIILTDENGNNFGEAIDTTKESWESNVKELLEEVIAYEKTRKKMF